MNTTKQIQYLEEKREIAINAHEAYNTFTAQSEPGYFLRCKEYSDFITWIDGKIAELRLKI